MKKKLLVPLALALCTLMGSCDDRLQYTGNIRYVYEGTVKDVQGNPMKGITVSTLIEREGSYGAIIFPGVSYETEVISYTKTDENGHYKMIFPKPSDSYNRYVLVNMDDEGRAVDNSYSFTQIFDIPDEAVQDYRVDFGTTTVLNLQQATTLTVNAVNPTQYWLGNVTMSPGIIADENYIDYARPENSRYGYSVAGTDDNESLICTVAPNQLITLHYTDASGVPQSADVYVGTSPVTYTIYY